MSATYQYPTIQAPLAHMTPIVVQPQHYEEEHTAPPSSFHHQDTTTNFYQSSACAFTTFPQQEDQQFENYPDYYNTQQFSTNGYKLSIAQDVGSNHGSRGSTGSFDLTHEDTASRSNDSGSNFASRTHDPYGLQASAQHQQRHDSHQRVYNEPQYPVYHSSGGCVVPADPTTLPPSLRQATLSRHRQEQNNHTFCGGGSNKNHTIGNKTMIGAPRGAPHRNSDGALPTCTPKEIKPFPACCHHKALANRMEFITPPSVSDTGDLETNDARSTNYLRVFIGQCRFESTPAEIRWLIHYLTDVKPVKVELRGTGCFMAYVQSYEEVSALLHLKEKMLFDHTGVWFARDEEQAAFLRRYVKQFLGKTNKGFRLPKDMVVLHDQQQVMQQRQKQRVGPPHAPQFSRDFCGNRQAYIEKQQKQHQSTQQQPILYSSFSEAGGSSAPDRTNRFQQQVMIQRQQKQQKRRQLQEQQTLYAAAATTMAFAGSQW